MPLKLTRQAAKRSSKSPSNFFTGNLTTNFSRRKPAARHGPMKRKMQIHPQNLQRHEPKDTFMARIPFQISKKIKENGDEKIAEHFGPDLAPGGRKDDYGQRHDRDQPEIRFFQSGKNKSEKADKKEAF